MLCNAFVIHLHCFFLMHNVHFTLSLVFSQVCRCQVISKTFLRSHQFCLTRFALSIDEFTWHNFGDPCEFGLCESRHPHAWYGIFCIIFLGRVRSVSLLNATSPHMLGCSELSCIFAFLLHIDIYIRVKKTVHI